jgi:hypothetical protein
MDTIVESLSEFLNFAKQRTRERSSASIAQASWMVDGLDSSISTTIAKIRMAVASRLVSVLERVCRDIID